MSAENTEFWKSWNSQVRELVRTFLKAQIIRSNPFLPWSMEGWRRLSSIAVGFSWISLWAILDEGLGGRGLGTVSSFQVLSSAVSDWFACKAGSFVDFFGEFEAEDS